MPTPCCSTRRLDADVTRKEIFGPVVCVYSYDDIDTAIGYANDLPYSFQAAVFTRNIDTAMHCYRYFDGTAITGEREHTVPFWTRCLSLVPGVSGHGVGGIAYTMHDMQTEKMMVWRSDALELSDAR